MHELSPPEEFVEGIGMYFQREHMPRIAGRMCGLLLLEGGPFSSTKLAERLDVSRASVSTNARFLTSLGCIQRVAVPGDRQDHYAIHVKGLMAMQRLQIRQARTMYAWFSEMAETLGDHSEGTRQRLTAAAILSKAVLDGLRRGAERVETQSDAPNLKGSGLILPNHP